MKSLRTLKINSGRLLKNDELLTLTGGWYGSCAIHVQGYGTLMYGSAAGSSLNSAQSNCESFYSSIFIGQQVTCGCCC